MKKIAKFFPVSAKKNLLRWFFIVLFSLQITYCFIPWVWLRGSEWLDVIFPMFYPVCLFLGIIKWGYIGALLIFLALANLASLIVALYHIAFDKWKWIVLSPIVFYLGNIILILVAICVNQYERSPFFTALSILENIFVSVFLYFAWRVNQTKKEEAKADCPDSQLTKKKVKTIIKLLAILLPILIVVLVLPHSGIFSVPASISKQLVYSGSEVHFGMTKEEVVAIKGEPTKITSDYDSNDGCEDYVYIGQINGRQAIYTYHFYDGSNFFYKREAVLVQVTMAVITHPDERQVIFKDARNALLADYSNREEYFVEKDSVTEVVFGAEGDNGINVRIFDSERMSKVSVEITCSAIDRTSCQSHLANFW